MCEDGVIELIDVEAGLHVLVAMLDEQPLRAFAARTSRFHMREHKAAVELLTV